MHEIHSVTEFRGFCNHTRTFLGFNAGKHQESTGGEKHAVNGTECPSYLKNRSDMNLSRYRLHVERTDGKYRTEKHGYQAYCETLRTAPCEMYPYVVRQYEIT